MSIRIKMSDAKFNNTILFTFNCNSIYDQTKFVSINRKIILIRLFTGVTE